MCSHDRKLSRGAALAAQRTLGSWLPTQQFGVTIEWIADHHQVYFIKLAERAQWGRDDSTPPPLLPPLPPVQRALVTMLQSSVPDPYVVGPPGSVSKRYWSGFFYNHQAKIVRKTLNPTVLGLFCDVLSLNNDVNVPSKSNEQKKTFQTQKKICFSCRLEGHWQK